MTTVTNPFNQTTSPDGDCDHMRVFELPDDLDPEIAVPLLRQSLWKNQYRPVAIYSHDADVSSGAGKRPFGNAWETAARQNPPAAISRFNNQARNTGILCDDLLAIDIDVDDAGLVAALRYAAEECFGSTPLVRYRDNSPRILMLYASAPATKRRVANPTTKYAVEVLGLGQQFVAFGRHPSGADLKWEGDLTPACVARADLPFITQDQVDEFLKIVSEVLEVSVAPVAPNSLPLKPIQSNNSAAVPITLEDVRAALAVMSHDGGDRDVWLKVGAAIYSVDSGPEGRAAFQDWSSLSPKYDQRGVDAQWKSFHASPLSSVSGATLIHMAKLADADFVSPSFKQAMSAKRTGLVTMSAKGKFQMMSIADVLSMPPPEWLIPGLLMQDTVAALYGPPASYKSFIALDLAMSLATGSSWNGHQLKQQGAVYVAAEGARGMSARLAAWLEDRGHGADGRFTLIPEQVPLNDSDAVEAFISDVKQRADNVGFPIKLVVLDTLARCSVGVDENSSMEMGLVLDAAIQIHRQIGATVLIVHHTGKDAGRGMRGSNRTVADMDTTIEIERTDDLAVTLHCRKQKDAEQSDPIAFEMRKVMMQKGVSSIVPVLTQDYSNKAAMADAVLIAEAITAADKDGVALSISSIITMLDLTRGKNAYDRIKRAVSAASGVAVKVKSGMRRLSMLPNPDQSKHGNVLCEHVS